VLGEIGPLGPAYGLGGDTDPPTCLDLLPPTDEGLGLRHVNPASSRLEPGPAVGEAPHHLTFSVEVDHGVGAHAKALLPDETLYHEDIATIQIYTRVAKKRKAKVISKVFDTDELPE